MSFYLFDAADSESSRLDRLQAKKEKLLQKIGWLDEEIKAARDNLERMAKIAASAAKKEHRP